MRQLTIWALLAVFAGFAADPVPAGRYTGEWKSGASGNGGEIRFTLEAGTAGVWKSELTFGLQGTDVKTTMREVKVQEGKIELLYDFDVQGVTARSRIKGEWNGTSIKGQYETTLVDGGQAIDSGTWNASRGK
jgi:hypothetical protein